MGEFHMWMLAKRKQGSTSPINAAKFKRLLLSLSVLDTNYTTPSRFSMGIPSLLPKSA
jgi:hypothetical protein